MKAKDKGPVTPQPRKVLVLPDIHCPVEDKLTLGAVEAYMKDFQPDELIYLGDLLDLNCISAHNVTNLRAVEAQRLDKDFAAAREILVRHRKLLPSGAKVTYLEGNHEHRLARYVDANPQTEGILDVERQLGLRDLKIRYIRSWSKGEVYRVGKAAFIHGVYVSPTHAKQHVEAYGENIFYGHVHSTESHAKTKHGDNKTSIAQSLGCLCKYDQSYMLGKPSRWQQAFGVFYFFPDGFFNYYVVSIFKHRFTAPNGVVYGG